MKGPESYQAGYPESAKKKFAIPRDAEGKPNQEVFTIARKFEDTLSKYQSFVGVALYGSKMKGYSNEGSDTDLAIFSEPPTSNKTDEHVEVSELRKDALEVSYLFGGPEKVHIEYHELNAGMIKHSVRNPNFYPGRIGLVHFLSIAVGPKVAEYRSILAQEVNALPEDKRTIFIDDMVNLAIALEGSRAGSVEDRIPSTRGSDLSEDRKDIWRKKIEKALHL